MIGYSINKLANAHKGLAALGGAILGRAAAKGSPFAALAGLGLFGQFLRQKKIDSAEQAARDAAINVGRTDPACADPSSPECQMRAEAAAVAAGRASMNRLGFLGKSLIALVLFMLLNIIVFWILVALRVVDAQGHLIH